MNSGNHRNQVITGFVILAVLAIVVLSANHYTQGLTNKKQPADDQLIGSGQGYKGKIVLEVVMEGDRFKEVKAIEFQDTSQVFNDVLKSIEDDLQNGKALEEIEVITGATATYHGIIEALKEAFGKVKK